MTRLVVLGAGRHQAPLIRRAEERCITTIAIDYYEHSPGKRVSSHPVLADALDIEAVLQIARDHEADAITTIGTDQTVLVLAEVAAALELPCHITPTGALAATNKEHMRRALGAAGVPMTAGVTVVADSSVEDATSTMSPPFVVKAADSQGQRGMQRIENRRDLPDAVRVARNHSRTKTVIVEEFSTGPELTLNVWMRDGEPAVVIPADRHTYNPSPAIGICLRHVVPSLFVARSAEMDDIARRVARGFGVSDGPLYIQMLAASSGFRVVEAACRVGGGHEAQLFEELFGLSLLDLTIDLAVGVNDRVVSTLPTGCAGLVNFVAAKPGRIADLPPFDDLVSSTRIAQGQWYVDIGHEQKETIDSMGRIGAFIIVAESREDALERARSAYATLRADDEFGNNLVVWPAGDQLNVDEMS